jgi:uncharacterized membrane protein
MKMKIKPLKKATNREIIEGYKRVFEESKQERIARGEISQEHADSISRSVDRSLAGLNNRRKPKSKVAQPKIG